MGYKLFLELKDAELTKNEKRKLVQPQLMDLCHNNPYANAMMIDCETKVAQQETWFRKRNKYLSNQRKTVLNKIEHVKDFLQLRQPFLLFLHLYKQIYQC